MTRLSHGTYLPDAFQSEYSLTPLDLHRYTSDSITLKSTLPDISLAIRHPRSGLIWWRVKAA